MKTKKLCSIVFIAILSIFALTVLHGQTEEETIDKDTLKAFSQFNADFMSLIESSDIDIQFTVTDTDGKPLDGVKMEMELTRTILGGSKESNKKIDKTFDSQIHIQEKGWVGLTVSFEKDGFYPESRRYGDIQHLLDFINKHPRVDKDKSKLTVQESVQITMTQVGARSPLIGHRGTLTYDFENGTRSIVDIDIFPKKGKASPELRKMDEQKSDSDENSEETFEEETRIKYIKLIGKTITMKSKEKPETVKYIEIDFKRDKDGNVIYDTTKDGGAKLTSCVVRFCSDDPDDGLLFVCQEEISNSEKAFRFFSSERIEKDASLDREAKKKLVVAPEKGYKKEIVADFGENPKAFCVLAFLKNGDHYGKVILGPGSIQTGKDKIQLIKMEIWVIFNRQGGERNVNYE
ncbi:MAG: hypothetical protein J5767_14405 [Paludibacteraceae bacterium]|nr:hypothetical protein [Paludibacteraceae bacterium]